VILSTSCDALRAVGAGEWLATNSALLGEALYRQGRFAEALDASETALAAAPPEHLTSKAVAWVVQAKALARLGSVAKAQALAAETVEVLSGAEALDVLGEAYAASAEVHALAGASAEADRDWQRAVDAFERKGNVVSAARVRDLR